MTDQAEPTPLSAEARKISRIAEQFADMARLSNVDSRRTGTPFNRLFAEGAVLAFAVELMLKTLHQQAFNKREHGHDLWKLYNRLPMPIEMLCWRSLSTERLISTGLSMPISLQWG